MIFDLRGLKISCCNTVLPIYDNMFLHKNLKQVFIRLLPTYSTEIILSYQRLIYMIISITDHRYL
jgi:hypothetical protein